jgi:histidinol phosphatase-like PHP family hydrolase
MRVGLDYHIHTFYQKCGNATLTIPNIVRRLEAMRFTSIAITDHLNRLDMLPNFRHIRRDMEQVQTELEIWFGVELNYMGCDGEFAYSEKIRDDYGFEIAIGGIHTTYSDSQDPTAIIDIQHRHHLRTLEDPLVDVLVHPYWFGVNELEKRTPEWWRQLLESIPDNRITELAQASEANHTAIELNAAAVFHNPNYDHGFQAAYVEFVERLARENALFAVGSDAHDINMLGCVGAPAWRPRRQHNGRHLSARTACGRDESRPYKGSTQP